MKTFDKYFEKPQTRYKVLNKYDCSIFMYGKASVKYTKDHFVTSPEFLRKNGYYLFVSKNIDDAIKYASGYYDYKIYRVAVKGRHKTEEELPIWLNTTLLSEDGLIEICKRDYKHPPGTEMWEYVKLLEELKI